MSNDDELTAFFKLGELKSILCIVEAMKLYKKTTFRTMNVQRLKILLQE